MGTVSSRHFGISTGSVWSKYIRYNLHDRPKMMNNDVCKFCYSNGEAESQYRTHKLKNSSGLVTCPVLRSFTCPICKATGDFAHTQRYCPRNKDGRYNSGASLSELKRRKNAAGNFPSSKKKMTCPVPSAILRGPVQGSIKVDFASSPTSSMDMLNASSHYPMTDPLPSSCRPPSPYVYLASQPPTTQLTLYWHRQYINYYYEQQRKHEKEFMRLQLIRLQNQVSSPAEPRYSRSFPMSVTPPKSPQEYFRFPDVAGCTKAYEEVVGVKNVAVKTSERRDECDIGSMLAELRMGTMEVV